MARETQNRIDIKTLFPDTRMSRTAKQQMQNAYENGVPTHIIKAFGQNAERVARQEGKRKVGLFGQAKTVFDALDTVATYRAIQAKKTA